MKQRFAVVFLLSFLISVIAAHGQCPSNRGQWEFAFSHGAVTADQVADNFNSNDISSYNGGVKTQTYSSGTTFITGRYFLYNRLALGFCGGVADERGHYADRYNPTLVTSTYKNSFTTIAMELYYIYMFRKYVEVYTLIGAGPSFTTTETVTIPTPYVPGSSITSSSDGIKAQYTPVGVRFGGKLGGFVELGIGYKGLINGGISFKFGSSCWWKG